MTFPAASSPETRAPWTARDTLAGAALTLVPLLLLELLSAGGSAPAKPLTPSQDLADAFSVLVTQIIIEGALLIAPIYYATRRAGTDRLRALGLRSTDAGMAVGLVILGLCLALVFELGYSALLTALHLTVQTNADRLGSLFHIEPLTVAATLLGAVLIAPVCEEIFFRGFLLPGAQRALSPWAAVAVTAVVFALAHGDAGSFVELLVLGVILCIVRIVTNSVWPCIALHAANNLLTAIVIVALFH
jgi:membrane protease YdiL (CAAX protease family)